LAAIGQFGGSKTGVVYVDRISSVFKARRFDAILKELAACLGGHALMGPLFGVPLLLVEGDDDYRIWSQVPRHHKTSFAVIPSNGDEIYEYQRVLEKIFGSLRAPSKPAGFALLDGDKNSPQPNPRSPQDHVQFVNLRCREAENLFLTDEVLGMVGTSWSRASATILKESSQYGNKASKLASVQSWNRQSEDLKDVINEINKIVDSKNVHWTLWVGRCIGRNKPSGQLADFLGPALIAALWA